MAKKAIISDLFRLTWDNIKSFDDIITDRERAIIQGLEKEMKEYEIKQCPCLKKDGRFFYYCAHHLNGKANKKLSPENPIYTRHTGIAEMQLHCMSSYKTCCIYNGAIKR